MDESRMGIKYNGEIRVIRASATAARVTKFPRTKLGSFYIGWKSKAKPCQANPEYSWLIFEYYKLQLGKGEREEEGSLSLLKHLHKMITV